jgi:N-acetylmuramoyl-L-alanine amidase
MVVNFKRPSYPVLTVLLIILGVQAGRVPAQQDIEPQKGRIVVIDPGHGGDDKGVISSSGRMEKYVALDLANLIKARLTPNYTVFLTRKTDYQLDLFSRTAVANHLKADVFISLHTGGSFTHQAAGVVIFYHRPQPREQTFAAPFSNSLPKSSIGVRYWHDMAEKNRKRNRSLAQILVKHLKKIYANGSVSSRGAPLIVLEGAQMPAVLIEVGYLTNPLDESQHLSGDGLIRLSQTICEALNEYFELG